MPEGGPMWDIPSKLKSLFRNLLNHFLTAQNMAQRKAMNAVCVKVLLNLFAVKKKVNVSTLKIM